jgi:Phosphotransferase enzyme family
VPLRSPRAAAVALARNHDATSRKSRLVKLALAAGLRVGVTQRLMPDRIDVAVEDGLGPGELAGVVLTEHLRRVFSRRDLEMAVILGPPRLNRKPVLQILSSDGEVLGYVKAAWNDLTRELVRNEARVLTGLARSAPCTFTPPSLVHHGTWGGLELLAASPLPHTSRPEEAQVFDPPMAVIEEIAGAGGISEAPLAAHPYWTGVQERLARRQDRLAGEPDALAPIAAHVEARHGATEFRFGTWHGDLTPWNMARLGKNRDRIFVWDWERSAAAPVGLDLLHFLFQSVCRFEGRNPDRAVEICRERTPRLLASLGVPAAAEHALWSVYRLELLFRYDEARLAGVLTKPSRIHSGILEIFEREMEAC